MSINRTGVTAYVGLGKGDAVDRFGTMAIGSGSTAESETDTQLVTELTSGGAARKSATVSLAGTNNEKLRFNATFAFTAELTIREANITNDQTPLVADTGDSLMREVFDANYPAIPGDTLTLDMDAIGSDVTSAQTGLDVVVTWDGIEQMHRLAGAGLTATNGPLTCLALGRDNTAPDATDTGCGDEIVAADGLDLGRAEYTSLTVSLMATNGFTDTIKIEQSWAIDTVGDPTVDVDEVTIETSETVGSGIAAARAVFDAPFPMNGAYADTLDYDFRYIVSIA